MPTRNAIKQYETDAYYHIYTRGVNKDLVFIDDLDKAYFLSLFKRYLSGERTISSARVVYKDYSGELELLSYCLMDNHIHILVYQTEMDAIARFMRSLMTSYSMYFNKRHGRVGHVFQSRYLARRIDSDAYLHHISRYIHRNPKDWRSYSYSSIDYYIGRRKSSWLETERVLSLFGGNREEYHHFVAETGDDNDDTDELSFERADGYIVE
ncbi:MAG: transposase [Candidatus Saccharimonadaceae bacterium]